MISNLLCYVRHTLKKSLLIKLTWLQDCLSLKPPSVLLALSVLHQYVVRVGGHSLDRKEARDLQEINAKLMEAVAAIAGSRLEAATWLRGTRTVRLDSDVTSGGEECVEAVRALNLLGELAATLLDIIYQSEEKERVLPLLATVMYNVAPYLRHHAASGTEMLCAGSRLLASLSEYPYTRSSCKSFFQRNSLICSRESCAGPSLNH